MTVAMNSALSLHTSASGEFIACSLVAESILRTAKDGESDPTILEQMALLEHQIHPDSTLLPYRVKRLVWRSSWRALRNNFWPFALFTGGAQQMFNPLMLLAAEANAVIALRMMKLMRGGRSARREANLMVSEKINAAFEATASLVAGASGDEIVHRYRQHVAKNAKRLSGRGRNRVLKRTRRRRK
jgi:hypothetical protein